MAVSIFFGLPGCGKTTLVAKKAVWGVNCGRYQNVYVNTPLKVDGVTCIDNDCIGQYLLQKCLILIDEATIFADGRDWKVFDAKTKQYFILHRHYKADIILFTQYYNGIDPRIRRLAVKLFHLQKGFWTGHWISSYYRIPYGIIIPDGKKTSGEKLGEIVEGYCKPPLIVRIFKVRFLRKRYYGYFDSWDAPPLPPLPDKYKAYATAPHVTVEWYLKRYEVPCLIVERQINDLLHSHKKKSA